MRIVRTKFMEEWNIKYFFKRIFNVDKNFKYFKLFFWINQLQKNKVIRVLVSGLYFRTEFLKETFNIICLSELNKNLRNIVINYYVFTIYKNKTYNYNQYKHLYKNFYYGATGKIKI